MKYIVTMKDPDYNVTDENGNDVVKVKPQPLIRLEKKFFEWGEYVTVELDTETGAARVVPVGE